MAEPEVESWQNATAGKVLVNKFDHNNQVVQEVVGPGRKTLITPKERTLLNSDRTYAEENDVFKNGFLVPLTPVLMADDGSELEENPNHITLTDMRALFRIRNAKQFEKAIKGITSPPVLSRLLTLAESGDEELDVTFNQRNVIKNALVAVGGDSLPSEVEHAGDLGLDDGRSMVGKFRAE